MRQTSEGSIFTAMSKIATLLPSRSTRVGMDPALGVHGFERRQYSWEQQQNKQKNPMIQDLQWLLSLGPQKKDCF